MRIHPISALFAVLIACGAAHPVNAQHDHRCCRHRFDQASGRDLRNYPPHRVVDILHQRIEVVIPDMNAPRMNCSTLIRFRPIAGDVEVLPLHGAELNLRRAASDGRGAEIIATPGVDEFEVRLDPPVRLGEIAEVRIDYEVIDPPEGVVWTPESPHWPGRAASMHTQGEPESNRYWFPTHDFPNERFTSEVVVTIPSTYTACSNGRLISESSSTNPETGTPARTLHFFQSREHAPYLVNLAVGQWDIADVSSDRRLPMPVYVPPGQGDRIPAVFGRTPKMLALCERLFDEPYPWEKYAQVVVTNFAWGGMENTSATTLYDTIALDATALLDGDEDGLIIHELAHQWFGDLVTCKSWEHIWLNEGWATFSEALWEQYRNSPIPSHPALNGPPTSDLRSDNDAYQYAIWSNFRGLLDADKPEAPCRPGMASKIYAFPDAVFTREADPYAKGAAVLHMLRMRLGDDLFWQAAALYMDRHRGSAVETFQMRYAFEMVSGVSLQRFFDQWCYRPGVPHLKVTPSWDPAGSQLVISVEQTQNIDGANPAFFFDLPIWVDLGSESRTLVVSMDTRSATCSFTLPHAPERIVVDPDLHVLAAVEIVQPPEAFAQTLLDGPTLAARVQAALHLAQEPGSTGVAALAAVARDELAHRGLRREAITALARLAGPPEEDGRGDTAALDALTALSAAAIEDARIRAELASAMASASAATREQRRPIIAWLLDLWAKDRSYGVRAACLKSLGKLQAADGIPAMLEGLKTESQHDQIRQAAIEALAVSGVPDALERIMPFTSERHQPETRRMAIENLPALAARDPDRVFNLLAALINDPYVRTRQVAVEAMLELDDPRARAAVDQWISAARSRADRLWGADALAAYDLEQAEEDADAAAGEESPAEDQPDPD